MVMCDMCGVDSFRLNDIVVERTLLSVCDRCKGYGNSVNIQKPIEGVSTANVPRKIFVEENVPFVIEAAGKMIQSTREKRGLKQAQLAAMVGIKESAMHKIETSVIKPEIDVAKKLEKILDIKIIDTYDDSEKSKNVNLDDENLTVGDLIKFKKSSD